MYLEQINLPVAEAEALPGTLAEQACGLVLLDDAASPAVAVLRLLRALAGMEAAS
jgi:hypothetical protein